MASAGPVSISGRKSSGRQKMVREVKDKLFLLNSAWKVMEKRRKETDLLLLQIHPSAFNTNFTLLTALSTALNLFMPPPWHYPSSDPTIYVEMSTGKGDVCVCVCLSAGAVHDQSLTPEQQSQCPKWFQSAEPPSHHGHCNATPGSSVHYFVFGTRFKRFWRLSPYQTFSG